MRIICAPSQVMRDGRDLNQHGQAGRQEQASSSSPLSFHEMLVAAAAALPGSPSAVMPHTIASETIDLPDMICFITFLSYRNVAVHSGDSIPGTGVVNIECARPRHTGASRGCRFVGARPFRLRGAPKRRFGATAAGRFSGKEPTRLEFSENCGKSDIEAASTPHSDTDNLGMHGRPTMTI